MIKKKGSQWCLYTQDGSKVLGCHGTKQGAIDQEVAIEQHRDASARLVHLRVAAGVFRVAAFQEREHVVVPIIALVEGVIHASNAAGPELVPAETLAIAPSNWNGRPVVVDHPTRDGEMVSASSSPEMLEQSIIGYVFNSRYVDKQLRMEAWIDVGRAALLGGKAKEMVDRIKAGDQIEVSVGAIVNAEQARGVYDGKPYDGVWVDLRPDHLALLSEGTLGACSNDMGCGVRAASAKEMRTMILGDENKSMFLRLFSMLRPAAKKQEPTESDRTKIIKVYDAIRAAEPGFLGIDETYSEEGVVIYSVMPEDKVISYRRSFTQADDGAVTLADDREEVEAVMSYQPVVKAAAAACGCGGSTPTAAQGVDMKKKADRIAALIADPKTPFKPEHLTLLEAASDDQLKAFEDHVPVEEEPKPAAETPVAPVVPVTPAAPVTPAPAAEAAPVTLEALISKASGDVQAAFATITAAAQAETAQAVATIKASGRCTFTDAQLAAKPLPELKALVALLGQPETTASFAGRGVPRQEGANEKTVAPPASLAERLRAASASKAS